MTKVTNRAVWKFAIPPKARFSLGMPKGAVVLHIEAQGQGRSQEPCMWALVDPTAESVERHFQVVGTGHLEINQDATHCGTVQLAGGTLVLHVFEVPA